MKKKKMTPHHFSSLFSLYFFKKKTKKERKYLNECIPYVLTLKEMNVNHTKKGLLLNSLSLFNKAYGGLASGPE